MKTGTATSAEYDSGTDTTTITYSLLEPTDPGSDWGADLTLLAEKTGSGRGALLIPDITSRQRWPLYVIATIDDPAPTIKVKGNATAATSIAIIYGQLIRRKVLYDPVHSTSRSVKLYNQEGTYAFAHTDEAVDVAPPDGILDDSTPNDICQICHTDTNHWRNDGTKSENHFSGCNCTKNCHKHTSNFNHGGGGGGENCVDCHNSGSHIIHLDTNDSRGPAILCDDCHDFDNMPKFKNQDESGNHLLSETDICNTCHSPAGTYDGIDDVDVGAKTNWDSGVYEDDKVTLKANKEKWCATCHDESPSQISGINAPNVIGDEDGAYIYGTGWGYYKTGHGLAAGETFPSKGGIETLSGRPVECDNCHDYSTAHIDGLARTFDDGDVFGLDPAIYRQGYRLKMIDGQEPYRMPRPSNIGNNSDQFRVCFQIGCHDSGPFTDSTNMNTNLVTDAGVNRHEYHLNFNNQEWVAADWSGAYNSRMTCVVCHNVHGSTQLAMVRDGKLINRELGMWIWYKNDAVTYIDVNTSNPPEPEDLPLSASDGTAWLAETSVNLCVTCHAWNIRTTDRTPFQDVAKAPLLEWVGTNGLISDGVAPDSAVGNSTFTFRVSYSDINNDSPSPIEVWVDLNDKDGYEADEKFTMAETDTTDTNIFNGKNYTKSISIAKTGDGVLNYRFYAYDGGLEATGAPTADSTVSILNNAPTLAWTGEDFYLADGTNPDTGGNGDTFTFRINYIDSDNEAPSIIQVWIDENDVDSYEAAEEYALTEVDSGDTTYSDGKLYTTTRALTLAGDNVLNYRFYATDGSDTAVGEAAVDHSVTVVDALKVRPVGGSGWYTTIQSAIDAVDGAHTVLVYEGTYNEDVVFEFGSKDSNTQVRSVCGPDITIINGSGSVSTVTFNRYSGNLLDGFQVTGGTTGILIKGTQVTINNCQVHDNNGLSGGGISAVQSGDNALLTLTNSEIYNNSSDRGAGIHFFRGTGHNISNSIIRNNTAAGDGAFDGGGGLYASQVGTLTISNSIISDNATVGNYPGGGLKVAQLTQLTVIDSFIRDNTTDSWGGGVYSDASTINFIRSSITGNTSATMGGAIAHPSAGVTTSFENCIMADNQANQAGMAKLNGGTLDIINSTIANNRATDHSGAIYNQLGTITIRNSILWGNQAGTVGHIAHFNGGSITITDSIIQNDDDGNFTDAPFFTATGTTVVSGFASEDDPWFVGSGDYHIQAFSPAIDNGSATYAPADDIDGDIRPQGAADDIGADEYTP